VAAGSGARPLSRPPGQQAVEEYDEDLTIARHEQTGEWVILLKRGPEGRPFPVFGLGPELPSPEAIKQKLYEGDVRRHGGRIMRARAATQAEAAAAESKRSATEEVADASSGPRARTARPASPASSSR
jgi:hypothetical protein